MQKKQFPTLQSLALDVVAKNYCLYPQLSGLSDRVKQTIIDKSIEYCSDSMQSVLLVAPHITQQKYWKALCQRNKRTFNSIKLQDHGFSYKIAFLQKFLQQMIQDCQKYQGRWREQIIRTIRILYPWIFSLQMKINANDLKIEQIMRQLGNVIDLKIRSGEGKNSDYKKKIIGMKFVQARDLSEVLKNTLSLLSQISLNLSGNLIDDQLFKFISPGLVLNTTLIELNLSYNKIGDDGAKRLSKYLIKNQILTHLNLSNNSIGYDGSRYIAQALKLNSTLQSLNVKLNSIDDKAGAKLFKDLTFNTNLKILDIEANLLSTMTVRKLSLYIQTPHSLREIYIGNNNFVQSDYEILLDSLPNGKSKETFIKTKYMQILI